MTKLFLDPAFVSQLESLTMPVELCDPSGRPLGRFVPASSPTFSLRPEDNCPYSADELEGMLQDGETMRLQDFWKTLEQA